MRTQPSSYAGGLELCQSQDLLEGNSLVDKHKQIKAESFDSERNHNNTDF